jgi:ketosteroid isomerase-like protein
MATPNVELARSICTAWERGDFSSTDWAHPEIEYVIADGPARGKWRGVTEMGHAWRNFLGSWADFRAVADEYRELDDERVLVLSHLTGRGKTSGLDVGGMRSDGAHLLHLHGGKVTRLVVYADRELALADLGLSRDGKAAGAPG